MFAERQTKINKKIKKNNGIEYRVQILNIPKKVKSQGIEKIIKKLICNDLMSCILAMTNNDSQMAILKFSDQKLSLKCQETLNHRKLFGNELLVKTLWNTKHETTFIVFALPSIYWLIADFDTFP